jgi:hypothetical protein
VAPGWLLLAFLSLLIVAACSDETAADAEVRPFSEVQETDFVFEADPTNPNRGIFRVRTTEPMICAIIWGEDESFGNFNNSLAMNGTGIIDHDVFLPEATPGVEYVFKVQGSTADGTLYESPVGTFTIPETAPAGSDEAELGPNLALEATVTEVSSEFSDSFSAANAIDGDTSTEWATSGSGDDAFITIDLGSEQQIAGVEFLTRSMADGSAIAEEYAVIIDGDSFGPFEAGTVAEPNVAEIDATGQVVRFDVTTSTGGNTGAVEVKVYGPLDQG